MHYSVLLKESIELLNIKPNGIYVDGTYGRGGHSQIILDNLGTNGKLIGFDKDIDAINHANLNQDSRFKIVHDSFINIQKNLNLMGIDKIDGLILDLGVSSPQLDTPDRGFSFRYDAPLDMRMDNSSGDTCASWLNSVDEKELCFVIATYGEERYASRIAKNIIKSRHSHKIETTHQLVKIITDVVPYTKANIHPATRTFQALRIKINSELDDLEKFLITIPNILAIYGRVIVISFHSLEDRIVKTQFNQLSKPICQPKWVMINNQDVAYKIIAKKIKPTIEEVNQNARSRSAIMRVLERIK